MTNASKATLAIGMGCTCAAVVLQFVVANWMHGVKSPGGPMSGMQVQFAAICYCIASFFLAGLGSIGMRIASTRAANYAAYPFLHFILAFVLFFVS